VAEAERRRAEERRREEERRRKEEEIRERLKLKRFMEMQEEIERQQEEEKKRLKVSSEEVKVMEAPTTKEDKEYNYHQQMMDQYRLQRFGDTSTNPDDDPSNYKRHKPLQKLSESTV
jgi:hypothetical protein